MIDPILVFVYPCSSISACNFTVIGDIYSCSEFKLCWTGHYFTCILWHQSMSTCSHRTISLTVHIEIIFFWFIPKALSSHRTVIPCESKGKDFFFLFFSYTVFLWCRIFFLSVYSLSRKDINLSNELPVHSANTLIWLSCLASLRLKSNCSYGNVKTDANAFFNCSILASLSEQ